MRSNGQAFKGREERKDEKPRKLWRCFFGSADGLRGGG